MLQTRQSAVSSTDWGVDMINKICKLRDTSGSFVLYFVYDMVFMNSTYEVIVNAQFHKLSLSRSLGCYLGQQDDFIRTIFVHNHCAHWYCMTLIENSIIWCYGGKYVFAKNINTHWLKQKKQNAAQLIADTFFFSS